MNLSRKMLLLGLCALMALLISVDSGIAQNAPPAEGPGKAVRRPSDPRVEKVRIVSPSKEKIAALTADPVLNERLGQMIGPESYVNFVEPEISEEKRNIIKSPRYRPPGYGHMMRIEVRVRRDVTPPSFIPIFIEPTKGMTKYRTYLTRYRASFARDEVPESENLSEIWRKVNFRAEVVIPWPEEVCDIRIYEASKTPRINALIQGHRNGATLMLEGKGAKAARRGRIEVLAPDGKPLAGATILGQQRDILGVTNAKGIADVPIWGAMRGEIKFDFGFSVNHPDHLEVLGRIRKGESKTLVQVQTKRIPFTLKIGDGHSDCYFGSFPPEPYPTRGSVDPKHHPEWPKDAPKSYRACAFDMRFALFYADFAKREQRVLPWIDHKDRKHIDSKRRLYRCWNRISEASISLAIGHKRKFEVMGRHFMGHSKVYSLIQQDIAKGPDSAGDYKFFLPAIAGEYLIPTYTGYSSDEESSKPERYWRIALSQEQIDAFNEKGQTPEYTLKELILSEDYKIIRENPKRLSQSLWLFYYYGNAGLQLRQDPPDKIVVSKFPDEAKADKQDAVKLPRKQPAEAKKQD